MKFIFEKEVRERADKVLVAYIDNTRSQIQKIIEAGDILVNGKTIAVNYKLKKDDEVEILSTSAKKAPVIDEELIKKIEIIKVAKDYLVVNKPAGLVVHNTESMSEYTLVDYLLENYSGIKDVGEDPLRPGIVHRLDKDVSGLMVVAKNEESFRSLKKQFQERTVTKRYQALVYGAMVNPSGVIDFPIARSTSGHKMAAKSKSEDAKEAITEFNVAQALINYTLVDLDIKTGRTHQIRVHMAAYNHPVVGDNLYSTKLTREKNVKLGLKRIFLVSRELEFTDLKGERVKYKVDLTDELKELLSKVK